MRAVVILHAIAAAVHGLQPSETWQQIKAQAATAANSKTGSVMLPYLGNAVGRHASLAPATAALLAERLTTGALPRNKLTLVLESSLVEAEALLARDLNAVVEGDPAVPELLTVFLHFKGFLALAAHRAASHLWSTRSEDPGAGQLALLLQGAASERTGVDIHPGAAMGAGVFIDHATGIVIGEQAAVGDDCYIVHGVTLGATGKEKHGRRHPHVGSGCTLGNGANVLGPITVGDGATIGTGATVTKDDEAGATVIDTGFMSNKVLAPRKKKS